MKKSLLILLFALGVSYWGWGQTTINFDDAAKWTAGSTALGSYASDHLYVDGLFSSTGGPALRNTTAAQDGFAGAIGTYSWRLSNVATVDWRITISSGGVSTFSMKIRRWDGSPSPNFNLEYSVNGGTNWTFVALIDNANLGNSSDWTTFNGTINSAALGILIRLKANGTTERIMVDDFIWTGYSSGGNIPPSISNIAHTPSSGITSVTTVSVSADVTDSDGTVSAVELHWGTASGVLPNTIAMSNGGSGDTYTTVSDIPAQANGTTVYYEVKATDDDADFTTSPEQSYGVIDPVTSPLPYSQTFDTDLGDCYTYSVAGASKNWGWDDMSGNTDGHAYMNGFGGANPEEDWLILPGINLNNYSNEIMQFYTFYEYGNDDENNYLKLYYSTDYSGVGDPTVAAWTELSFLKATIWGAWQPSYIVDLSGISGINVFIGFKYYSTAAPRSWRVDDISVFEGSLVDVTFQVNMAEQTVSGDGVHIAGSFDPWWNPAGIEMLDPENDEVYSATLSLYSGIEYQYKYVNGNAWGQDEVVPAECRADGTSNRFEIVESSSYSIDPVCFASCVNCGVLVNYDMTFKVNMNGQNTSNGVNIAGSFNGWTNTPMTNTGGTIWEVTLSLPETSYQEYKFKNGNDGWESFDGPCLASSWGNRYLNVPSANTTLDLVCFNSCEACPVADFVMINEVDSDTPGTDALEFVELYDGGVGNTDLTGLVLVFYNGSNDLSYAAYDLDGYSTDANGYFVLGSSTVPNVDMLFLGTTDQIQNGADAIALFIGSSSDFPNNTAVTASNLLDALVYDTSDPDDAGLLALLNPSEPQINESGRGNSAIHSCQRIPNGSGGLRNTSTYDVALPTPGAMNYPVYTDWTGLVSNSWDESGNWNYGVPTSVKEVTIPNVAKAPFPVISASAICANLTLNLGSSLQINPTGSLTVTGTFTNNGLLTIKSDATGTGSLIENNGVAATVERYLTADEWHYISAPVDNPLAGVFMGMYMMEWDEPTGTWTYISDENYPLTTDMEGFAIWTMDPGTAVFSGNLNTGAKSIMATNTMAALHNNKGFNFAGNPYPSSLDWNVDDGSGWTRTSGNIDLSLYIWNQTYLNYGVYVKGGGTGTNDVDNVIPPHQGFFVSVSPGQATGTLGVNNGARIHASKDILKSGEILNDLLKFRVTGNNYADEMIVQINPLASVNADQLDATKFRGSAAAPQLYSISKDNRELSINSFPVQDDYMVIPVGLEVGADAVYTISVSDFAGFEFSSGIYLEDLKEGTFTKLEGNSVYSFNANPLDEPMRFLLHMSSELAVPENNVGLSSIRVYSFNSDVYVTSENGLSGKVMIYDLLGREIVNEKLTGGTMNKFDLSGYKGYLVVRVTDETGNLNQKVYIR